MAQDTPKNILIIIGHPDTESFSHELAKAYAEGARETGAVVRVLELSKLRFDPILHRGYKVIQELEPDLLDAQKQIVWANHTVWVYPVWWGSTPALLKGFLDRAFLPGWGFKYHANDPFWDRLLSGRSARIIITADAPNLWAKLVYHNPAINMMKRTVLEFCGFKPVRVTEFGQVRSSKTDKRSKWLAEVRKLGRSQS